MESTLIKIDGMSCGGCVKSISGLLSAMPGVAKVDVSLSEAQAVVEFDPQALSRGDLLEAIAAAGFEAS